MRRIRCILPAIIVLLILGACADDPVAPVPDPPDPPYVPDPTAVPVFVNEWQVDASSMAVGDDGLVYVVQWGPRPIIVYSAEGDSLDSWQPVLDGVQYAPVHANCRDGRFVFMGTKMQSMPLRPIPRIAVFDQRRRHVADWYRRVFTNSYAGRIDGIAIDADANIYTVEYMEDLVVKFDAEGDFVDEWPGRGLDPPKPGGTSGIAVGNNGVMYATDSFNNGVFTYSRDGEYLSRIGSFGLEADGYQGPAGIAIDAAGSLHIADTYNRRIVKTDTDGGYLGHFNAGEHEFQPWLVRVHGRHVYVISGSIQGKICHFEYEEESP